MCFCRVVTVLALAAVVRADNLSPVRCPTAARLGGSSDPVPKSSCAKFIYLHVPKCGGTSVMNSLSVLGRYGVHIVNQDSYSSGSLENELTLEGLMPRRWPRKVIEIHINSGVPYLRLHAKILGLRSVYRKAGCRVSLGVLLREPESLAKSWYSYCSRRHNKYGTKYGLPPFWSLLRACGRRNVMTNFLASGAFCERPTRGQASRQIGAPAIGKLAGILRDFDLRDDVRNMGAWMGRVFDFLQVDRRHCRLARINDRGSFRGSLNETELRAELALSLPIRSTDMCRCSPETLRLAKEAQRLSGNGTAAAVGQDEVDWLTALDKRLYRKVLQ